MLFPYILPYIIMCFICFQIDNTVFVFVLFSISSSISQFEYVLVTVGSLSFFDKFVFIFCSVSLVYYYFQIFKSYS